jgi:hypothetical protein
MTVKWKIKDRVVETESIDPGHTSVSLISINAASGDIFQVGADSTGSSHLGTWKFQKTGDAVLNLDFTTAANHWAQIITTGDVPDITSIDPELHHEWLSIGGVLVGLSQQHSEATLDE